MVKHRGKMLQGIFISFALEILIEPNEPSAGVRAAFILDDGAPVELLQFYTAKAVGPTQCTLPNNALHLTAARVPKECAVAGERER